MRQCGLRCFTSIFDHSMTLILRDRDALFALGRALEAAHYRFTTITPASHERINARPGNEQATDLRGVFGWSRPFARDAIAPAIVDLMQRAGVLDASGPLLRSTVRASTLGERCYFHSAWPTERADSVFFGYPDIKETFRKHRSKCTETGPVQHSGSYPH